MFLINYKHHHLSTTASDIGPFVIIVKIKTRCWIQIKIRLVLCDYPRDPIYVAFVDRWSLDKGMTIICIQYLFHLVCRFCLKNRKFIIFIVKWRNTIHFYTKVSDFLTKYNFVRNFFTNFDEMSTAITFFKFFLVSRIIFGLSFIQSNTQNDE
jgi:hypothetical protein